MGRRPFCKITYICIALIFTMMLSGCASPVKGYDRTGGPRGEADLIKGYDESADAGTQEKRVVRIGVFRGEDYWYWNDELKFMAEELSGNGILSEYQSKNYPSMDETWEALCESVGVTSRARLEFIPEYYFTYNIMSEKELDEMLAIDDLDLMLTFGTVAGKFMTANADRISYDYMVYGATNTVASGIVKSETERFNDHAFALVDTTENERIIRAVHDIYPFKSIGVVYEDTDEARIYSGVEDLYRLKDELGFKIYEEHVDEAGDYGDAEPHYTALAEAYERLIPNIDALFVTTGTIEDYERTEELLGNVMDAGIVTITQESEEQCELGCLMFFKVTAAEDDGIFMAKTLAEYSDGTPITKLEQVFICEPKLFLNYDTIKRTGIKLPMKAYMAADTIYSSEDE